MLTARLEVLSPAGVARLTGAAITEEDPRAVGADESTDILTLKDVPVSAPATLAAADEAVAPETLAVTGSTTEEMMLEVGTLNTLLTALVSPTDGTIASETLVATERPMLVVETLTTLLAAAVMPMLATDTALALMLIEEVEYVGVPV